MESMTMITRADLSWWLALVPHLDWTFAKTMPDAPHSYVIRDKTLASEDFERAVKVIRTFGEPGKFYSRTNVYLTVGNTKWWTMGAPVKETTVINKAKTDDVYGDQNAPHTATGLFTVYDELATDYDDRYTSPECLAENTAVWRLITDRFHYNPTVLDVGAGTGLLLDLSITRPRHYTGVDPSQGMLNELVRKHTDVHNLLPMTMEAAMPGLRLEKKRFDLVAGLFGSPSYVHPETIAALPSLATRMVMLMHYEKGYLPDYEANIPVPTADSSREAAFDLLKTLPGFATRIGHFDVIVVDLMDKRS